MLFIDALKLLQVGEYLVREIWSGTEYIAHMPGMQSLWKVITQPNAQAGNWLPFLEDMLADDWKVFERVDHKKVD